MTNITVVLSAYKRIENIELQLDAINNQTLKPKEIILFQDGSEDEPKINIPQEILEKFNFYEISPTNQGVWARFKFAQKASSEYICLFDDDTIPGPKWLENCYNEMQKQEGIYGTIGIVMQKPENYPFADYVRVGWACPCKTTMPVDFVGHSWFFKKEWLNAMFDNTENLQEFKYAGEDMTLSAKAQQKYGIKTFVPPHPLNDLELWGSNYKKAISLGNNKNAVSHNIQSQKRMNESINILINSGFKTLSMSNPDYTNQLFRAYKKTKLLTKIIPGKNLRHSLRLKLIENFYTKTN